MESPSHEIEDLDETPNRPNITPQDEIVSSYLEKRSAIFRDLVKLQSDVWNDPQAAAYFKGLRKKVDNPRKEDQLAFFLLMVKIGDEIDAASGGGLSLQNSHAQVLDLGMAPGGFTRSVQKRNQHAYVCAFTLPPELGGHEIIHYEDPRVNRMFGDITMLHQELRITDLPKDHPEFSKLDDSLLWSGKTFDLIFCDGQALRTHQPYIAEHRRQVEVFQSSTKLRMRIRKSPSTSLDWLKKYLDFLIDLLTGLSSWGSRYGRYKRKPWRPHQKVKEDNRIGTDLLWLKVLLPRFQILSLLSKTQRKTGMMLKISDEASIAPVSDKALDSVASSLEDSA